MITYLVLVPIVLASVAGVFLWQVTQHFFTALEAEYDFQLSRDPEYKKRRRVRRKPLGQKIVRLARRGAYQVKRPLYNLAVALGVKR